MPSSSFVRKPGLPLFEPDDPFALLGLASRRLSEEWFAEGKT